LRENPMYEYTMIGRNSFDNYRPFVLLTIICGLISTYMYIGRAILRSHGSFTWQNCRLFIYL